MLLNAINNSGSATPSFDPLNQLKDIHLPDPISVWPPALGWWILTTIILAAIVSLSCWLIFYYKKNAYRRHAIKQLQTLTENYNRQNNKTYYANNINKLLKQVAVTYYSKKSVSSLTGKAWLTFLDNSAKMTDFSQGAGQILETSQYQLTADFDAISLSTCCKKWLKHHA